MGAEPSRSGCGLEAFAEDDPKSWRREAFFECHRYAQIEF
jgi:hypothetical protein